MTRGWKERASKKVLRLANNMHIDHNHFGKYLPSHLLYRVVYERNHYFGLGPIPDPKPKLADTFGRYRIFSIICCLKCFRLFLKIWVYFQAYKNLYPKKEVGNMRKIEIF